MTLLPTHDAKDRPDLPEYPLGPYCMVKGCQNLREEGGGHHVWRRSAGLRSWWVELSDGTHVPNRVGLCWEHHRAVTGGIGGHTARIDVTSEPGFAFRLVFVEIGSDSENRSELVFNRHPYKVLSPWGMQQTIDGREIPHEQVVGGHERFETKVEIVHDHELKPGVECPECHRRIPYPKKKSSPKSKVFAYRVPIGLEDDDRGEAEVHGELLEAAARELEILEEPHWRWKLANYSAALILQGARLTERGA